MNTSKERGKISIIYIIRHCKAEGQEFSASLTNIGEVQSKMLTEFLLPLSIDRVISSPMVRACESIELFTQRSGVTLEMDQRLSEWVLCESHRDDWRDCLKDSFANVDKSLDGGESLNEAMNRGISVIEDLKDSGFNKTALVTHGGMLTVMLKYYNSWIGFDNWERLTNPDVFEINTRNSIINRIWK
ncbi:2,3-bisphosphoglycerate-dependent phosphoglycerate mutase [Marininema mesophilum]|uniref:2,3-bisphosphoglycerate-dependent phosphoglycerate mutase n=1 Tax=Marininema mesophilum TaxID=1048340 RepID=A0A1H2ZMM0_9BACL|nr:histidine phosphatase family protein [Marininema mesophilum]SDX18094.1 2,3-bisphosphoglycerate-dependent phosphoglycerate mutase [Marininema mesophilum]